MGTTKIKPHVIIDWFFHKILHDFEVKNPISSIKRIELSVKFKLFQWCHDLFTVLCLSLDWKIHFNLDFVLKSFRCGKGDVWYVLWTNLRMIPQNVVGKIWVMKLRKIDTRQKIWRMNWTVTAMISCIYFLLLLLKVSY